MRDKLKAVYKRHNQTSLLPWLRGHQDFPMTDFYTNSRMVTKDRHGQQTGSTSDLVEGLTTEDEVCASHMQIHISQHFSLQNWMTSDLIHYPSRR